LESITNCYNIVLVVLSILHNSGQTHRLQ
jgi:hypothetical protein